MFLWLDLSGVQGQGLSGRVSRPILRFHSAINSLWHLIGCGQNCLDEILAGCKSRKGGSIRRFYDQTG